MRKRRCVEIMKALEIQGKQSNLKDTINQYNVITENLIKLSDYPSGNKVKVLLLSAFSYAYLYNLVTCHLINLYFYEL